MIIVEDPDDALTVLLVARGEALAPVLAECLRAQGVAVETSTAENAAPLAFAAAVDLVVLAGHAAHDGGRRVAAALRQRPATGAIPIVLLTDDAADVGWNDEHSQIAAIIQWTPSAHEAARRIAAIARGLLHSTPPRSRRSGPIDAARTHERAGIVSAARSDERASLAGAPLATEPLDSGEPERVLVEGRRCLLVARSAATSDCLVQELRAAGALLAVCDGRGCGIDLARRLTPEVVVVDREGVTGWAMEALHAVGEDPVLRWASLVAVDWEPMFRAGPLADIAALAAEIAASVRADQELTARIRRESRVTVQLQVLGPIRMLRSLLETKLVLHVVVRHPRGVVDVDLAEGLVAGARARELVDAEAAIGGTPALAALLALETGEVTIEHADAPQCTEVMAPLDAVVSDVLLTMPLASAPVTIPTRPAPPSPEALRQSRVSTHGNVSAAIGHATEVQRRQAERADTLADPLSDHDAETERMPPALLVRLRQQACRSLMRHVRSLSPPPRAALGNASEPIDEGPGAPGEALSDSSCVRGVSSARDSRVETGAPPSVACAAPGDARWAPRTRSDRETPTERIARTPMVLAPARPATVAPARSRHGRIALLLLAGSLAVAGAAAAALVTLGYDDSVETPAIDAPVPSLPPPSQAPATAVTTESAPDFVENERPSDAALGRKRSGPCRGRLSRRL